MPPKPAQQTSPFERKLGDAAKPSLAPAQTTASPQRRQGDRGDTDDAAAPPVFGLWVRFKDLKAAGIVHCWSSLIHLIDDQNFPPGILLGPNSRAWKKDDVDNWLAGRPAERKDVPLRRRNKQLETT